MKLKTSFLLLLVAISVSCSGNRSDPEEDRVFHVQVKNSSEANLSEIDVIIANDVVGFGGVSTGSRKSHLLYEWRGDPSAVLITLKYQLSDERGIDIRKEFQNIEIPSKRSTLEINISNARRAEASINWSGK